MSLKLKPYPEYKDSGIPWLGEIPAHWQTRTLRRLARVQLSNVDKHTIEGETPVHLCNYTDVYYRRFITPDIEFMKASAVPREIEKFGLRRGDVLITKDSESWADIAVPACVSVDMPGVLCGYHLAQIRPYHETFRGEYLFRAFQAEPIAHQFRVAANGVTRFGLSGGAIAAGLFPIPTQAEQDAIVDFLARVDHFVDRLILAKQRLIELLNEQKQAVVHRAVTLGLDPDASMKPTGLDWLPEVPEHWEVAPLRRFTTSRCDGPFGSGLKSSHYTKEGVRVVRLQNIGEAEFLDRDAAYIAPAHYALLGDHDVLRGDLLIAGLGDERSPAGRACVAPDGIQPAMVKADCFRFRPRTDRIVPEFVASQLSATARSASAIFSTGATRQRMNLQATAGRFVAVPPLSEQGEILEFLTEEGGYIRAAVQRARREIDLIREYRTRLISDVVTGKLDVRGVELPEPDEDAGVSLDGLESAVAEDPTDPGEVLNANL